MYVSTIFVIFSEAGLVQLRAGLTKWDLYKQQQGQTTTPGGTFPTLCLKCVGSSTFPAN